MSEVTQEQVDELVAKPRNKWTAADRVLLTKARKAGFKVELPEAPKAEAKPKEAAPKAAPATAPPPGDDPQAQARYLEQKPKGQWTAADRVLLTKLRKQDVAVNIPEAAPAEKAAGAKAPPKKEPPKKPEKQAEPELMGPYLQTIYRMRTGAEEIVPEKLEEMKSKADSTLKEVTEAMEKEDFTLEELAKKDITLRQRYERAMLIHEGLSKLEEPAAETGGLSSLLRLWQGKKESASRAFMRKG